MLGTFKDGVNNKKPIVIPICQPHSIFSEVDLKFLDDLLEGAKEWVEENRDLTDEWVK